MQVLAVETSKVKIDIASEIMKLVNVQVAFSQPMF